MKTIFIESDISSFEDFHDREWFMHLFEVTDGTEIQKEIEDFLSHWWGASRAFMLPWLLVNGVYDAISGAGLPLGKTREDIWEEYSEINAFKGALWKTAESAFSSIYYAYENLIVGLLNKTQSKRFRVTDRDFNSIFINEFGMSLASSVWNDSFVAVSREVRNCLVHNGGKVSTKLREMRPLPVIKDEDILISATDVKVLYEKLKPKVFGIVKYFLDNKGS